MQHNGKHPQCITIPHPYSTLDAEHLELNVSSVVHQTITFSPAPDKLNCRQLLVF